MPRLLLLSDLHFEFHKDAGESFVASLAPTGIDVLVLAGDIAVGAGIGPALDLMCARFRASTVVYVHGMGEQRRFEEMCRLIDGLDAYANALVRESPLPRLESARR